LVQIQTITFIPKQKLKIIKQDPRDNLILECAIEGGVEYIVSGDKHLFDLKRYKDIEIVSVREFTELLRDRKS
jgi:hypothetical protein